MAYRQSPTWTKKTASIYDLSKQEEPIYHTPHKEAWLLFRHRKDYDIIHTMGIVESMTYGLLCLLIGSPSKQIMTEIFIDEEQLQSLRWRLKTALYRTIVHRSLGIITNSHAEIPALTKRFAISENKCVYVPLNTTVKPSETVLAGEGFILAAGRSLRDYPTLLNAAEHIHAPIVIIGGNDDLNDAKLPSNVTLLREVDRDTYLDYVRRCSMMVLPLLHTLRPTGQVVLLEAMSFGKPTIASEQAGTVDYIQHNHNGLLIPGSDARALADAVQSLLLDEKKATTLGQNALSTINKQHSNLAHTTARLAALESLAQSKPR